MKVAIISIGSSRGVRLPKAELDQVGFGDEAEPSVEAGRVELAPCGAARRNWAQAFAADPADPSDEDRDWLEALLQADAAT